MRILTRGSVTEEVTCCQCRSLLEVEPCDLQSQRYMDIDGSCDTDYFIHCPVCNHKICFHPYQSKLVKAYQDLKK